MSHIAPIERRLHLGFAAPVTAQEVGELLGIGDDERDRLLERVPPLARGPRGGLRYLWARVLEALETKAPEAPKPANRLPLAGRPDTPCRAAGLPRGGTRGDDERGGPLSGARGGSRARRRPRGGSRTAVPAREADVLLP